MFVSLQANHLPLTAVALLSLVTLMPVESHAANLQGSFRGHAQGATANAKFGPASASFDRASHKTIACEGTRGTVRSARLDGLAAGPDSGPSSLGAMRSSVYSDKTATSAVARNVADISDVNLLGGRITADTVKGVARISASRSRLAYSITGSGFENLNILGNLIPEDVAPNTRIPLPGLGNVTVKRVVPKGDFQDQGSVTVQMLSIAITQANSLSLPVGSRIVVGQAVAGYDRTVSNPVGVAGVAYLSEANAQAGEDVQNGVGKAAVLHLACEGTGGEVRTRRASSLTVEDALALGYGETTAFSRPTRTGMKAIMTANVDGVQLLGGIVTMGSVRAVASDRIDAGVRTSSSAGTGISDLTIAGVPLGNVTEENIQIDVPLVGYIILNEVIPPAPGSKQRLRVNGARLVVESLGAALPVGSEIIVAHAEASASR
jgi:hypothetical protein